MIMVSEVWKILYVIGMIIGIGFCALCVLMCILIGVMVIRACVTYDDDDIWDTQSRQVSKEKADSGTQVSDESEEKWSDGEENKENEEEKVWLVSTPNGAWVKTEGKKVYMRVGEGDERDEIR